MPDISLLVDRPIVQRERPACIHKQGLTVLRCGNGQARPNREAGDGIHIAMDRPERLAVRLDNMEGRWVRVGGLCRVVEKRNPKHADGEHKKHSSRPAVGIPAVGLLQATQRLAHDVFPAVRRVLAWRLAFDPQEITLDRRRALAQLLLDVGDAHHDHVGLVLPGHVWRQPAVRLSVDFVPHTAGLAGTGREVDVEDGVPRMPDEIL